MTPEVMPLNLQVPSSWRGKERRARTRRLEEGIFENQLGALVVGLRLSNAYKLRQMEIELTIQLVERITRELKTNDNPVLAHMLLRTLENWSRTAEAIIGVPVRLELS